MICKFINRRKRVRGGNAGTHKRQWTVVRPLRRLRMTPGASGTSGLKTPQHLPAKTRVIAAAQSCDLQGRLRQLGFADRPTLPNVRIPAPRAALRGVATHSGGLYVDRASAARQRGRALSRLDFASVIACCIGALRCCAVTMTLRNCSVG